MTRRPDAIAARALERERRIVRRVLDVPADPRLLACAGCGATVEAWRDGSRYGPDGEPHDCAEALPKSARSVSLTVKE